MSMPNIPEISPDIQITRDQSIAIILSSIGMEELSLAHLVNAEAEKIQFALGTLHTSNNTPASLPEIIETNQSAQKMFRDIIKNQMLLGMKMEDTIELAFASEPPPMTSMLSSPSMPSMPPAPPMTPAPPTPLFSTSDITFTETTTFPLSDSVFNILKDTTTFTLISSVIPTNVSGPSSIFSIGNSSLSVYDSHFHIFYQSGVIGLELRDRTKGRLLDQRVVVPADVIANGTLVNIGFSADPSTGYKLFVNGTLASTVPPTDPFIFIPDITDMNHAILGETQRDASKAYPLLGEIKNIEIYDILLDDASILSKTQL